MGLFSNLKRVEPRQIYKMASARGTIIRVRSGIVWLTEVNVTDDHFLSCEQTYRIRSRGVVLIESADMNAIEIEIEIKRTPHARVARLACRVASDVMPIQRLKARLRALGSETACK